mgnify:CR=1 FL=1
MTPDASDEEVTLAPTRRTPRDRAAGSITRPRRGSAAEYRDRDRIGSSPPRFAGWSARRRVFVNHERRTCIARVSRIRSKVAQIGRNRLRVLRLNETPDRSDSVSRTISGIRPSVMQVRMRSTSACASSAGSSTTLQSLRVVDETRGPLRVLSGPQPHFRMPRRRSQHCSPVTNARLLGEIGERFLRREQPGLEAQLANLRRRGGLQQSRYRRWRARRAHHCRATVADATLRRAAPTGDRTLSRSQWQATRAEVVRA